MRKLTFILVIFLAFLTTNITGQNKNKMEVATFGSGCFWCTEALFTQLKGVESAVSGYSGGQVKKPTYTEVCKGNTGHAEVIQVSYNPDLVSYEDLLEVFGQQPFTT